jgi:dipeptidyl aminopeptidase/acylaminoacyl peptidase
MAALHWWRGLAIAISVAGHAAPAAAEAGPCSGVISEADTTARRHLRAEDLVRLRDIGAPDRVFPDAGSIALSPDTRNMAFQIRRAAPETNDYCLAMIVMSVSSGAKPRVVDQGGELIRGTYDFRGKAAFPTGIAVPIAPRWSPDGTWIAFLKRVGSSTQVWRAYASGQQSAAITRSPIDVENFRIGPEGRSIVYVTRPGLALARQQIEAEGLSGFHYDDRYSPMASGRPFPAPPIGEEYRTQEIDSGEVRPATDAEVELLTGKAGSTGGTVAVAHGPAGRKAWIIQSEEDAINSRSRLYADDGDGRSLLCEATACSDRVGKIWWAVDGRTLRYFRREGWSREATAIYEWRPGDGPPRRLYLTNDILVDCLALADDLLCLRESAVHPRQITLLTPSSGTSAVLFDPNPAFKSLQLGRVERARWRNNEGLEVYGDVVLPVGYRRGQRYPLIIVQYESRGFLRGGTGDEYPIQAFANRGYVVLSFNRPQMIGLIKGGKTAIAVERENLIGFADRRSILSALQIGIERLVDRGIVDKERIGITGLSDGTTTVQFALSNGVSFAAAAISSMLWEPTYAGMVGPAAAREFAEQGYPKLPEDNPEFWRQFSVARNARAIRTPLLMQLADDSYLGSLEGLTALRAQRVPVDLFIFPNEYHIKWQPAHRLAVYQRNLDWFDFWLKNEIPTSETGRAEAVVWSRMKEEWRR